MHIGNNKIGMCRLGNRIINKMTLRQDNSLKYFIGNSFLTYTTVSPEIYEEKYKKLIGNTISGTVSYGIGNSEDNFIQISGSKIVNYNVSCPTNFITSVSILGDSYFDSMTGLFFDIKFCGQTFTLRVQVGNYALVLPDGTNISYTLGEQIDINLIYNSNESKYVVRVSYKNNTYDFDAINFEIGSQEQFSISNNDSGNYGTSTLYFSSFGLII